MTGNWIGHISRMGVGVLARRGGGGGGGGGG